MPYLPPASRLCFAAITIALGALPAAGQPGPPAAAPVAIGHAEEGRLTPTAEFKGTVFFKEVSELATEVSGKAVAVEFEEGDHVQAGAVLVRLDYDLLAADLDAARAVLRQAETQLAQEQVRLERAKLLLKDEATTEQEYDDIRFTVESLGYRVAAAKADIQRIEREIDKKSIPAPFDGLVLTRSTELGEWKREGDTVAILAHDGVYDVVVNTPEANLTHIREGAEVSINIGGEVMTGQVVAIIARGDVATRTFPVKVRLTGRDDLREGQSAAVRLPIGKESDCIMVPRDAVLLKEGRTQICLVRDDKAVPVDAEVLGYAGLKAGVRANGLEPGMPVVVKGHERLRPGQDVTIMP